MINNHMNKSKNEKDSKVNDKAGFYFSSSVKIFDPNTKQVLVHKRGDS